MYGYFLDSPIYWNLPPSTLRGDYARSPLAYRIACFENFLSAIPEGTRFLSPDKTFGERFLSERIFLVKPKA